MPFFFYQDCCYYYCFGRGVHWAWVFLLSHLIFAIILWCKYWNYFAEDEIGSGRLWPSVYAHTVIQVLWPCTETTSFSGLPVCTWLFTRYNFWLVWAVWLCLKAGDDGTELWLKGNSDLFKPWRDAVINMHGILSQIIVYYYSNPIVWLHLWKIQENKDQSCPK